MNTPTYLFSFIAGLLSILSPCVLPLIPIIITGNKNDSRFRPILIVVGLAITFVLMGILSTLFGQLIAPYMHYLEKAAGILIIIFGVLFLADINLFKNLKISNRLHYNGHGIFSGLILGMTLGLIWIPCVGPVLSSILAMVASTQDMSKGILLLLIYSAGFSIPLLLTAYSSHLFREKISILKTHPKEIRIISGTILILFGLYILIWGMIGFSY